MNELNNDWVLWGSLLAILFSAVSLFAYGWKAFRSMDSSKGKDEE